MAEPTRADKMGLCAIERGENITDATLKRLISRKFVARSKGVSIHSGVWFSWWVTRAGIKIIHAMAIETLRLREETLSRHRNRLRPKGT